MPRPIDWMDTQPKPESLPEWKPRPLSAWERYGMDGVVQGLLDGALPVGMSFLGLALTMSGDPVRGALFGVGGIIVGVIITRTRR